MKHEELLREILTADIEEAESILFALKGTNQKEFNWCIDNLKLHFILSRDILIVNKLALIFSTFKLHSTVPLMISKLFDNVFLNNGGTIIYALNGLRTSHFKDILIQLRDKDINYEMKTMLQLLYKS